MDNSQNGYSSVEKTGKIKKIYMTKYRAVARSKTLVWQQQRKSKNIGVAAVAAAKKK